MAGTVRCPIVTCRSLHEIKTTKGGNPFVWCEDWKQAVFFRNEGRGYLQENSGGRASVQSNPIPEERVIETFGSGEADDYVDVEAHPNPSPADPFVRGANAGLGVSVGRDLPWFPQPGEPAEVTETRSKALEQFESLAGPLREERELWREKRLALERSLRSASDNPEEQEPEE